MATEVIKIDREKPDEAAIEHAAELVRKGKLVVFPTETVYGIACKVGREELARLDEVKGRPADKRYTLHISEPAELGKYMTRLGLKVGKLVRGVWPGPVTVVFEMSEAELEKQKRRLPEEVFESLYMGGTIGVRCPEDRIAAELLAKAKVPVVAPSANKAGQEASIDGGQAMQKMGSDVDLVLDAGMTRYKGSSTVVKAGSKEVEVLRAGVVTKNELEAKSEVKFLFVCTGNTCRSPMAAGFFAKYLAEKLGCDVDRLGQIGYKVYSAGVMGLVGLPASPESVVTCGAKGVDLRGHRSRAITKELIDECDLIFGMCKTHCEQVAAMSPTPAKKCRLLAGGMEIVDPIGMGQDKYNQCAGAIEEAAKRRVGELLL
jgi:L-threonylcarbamoyladenylate synthase